MSVHRHRHHPVSGTDLVVWLAVIVLLYVIVKVCFL